MATTELLAFMDRLNRSGLLETARLEQVSRHLVPKCNNAETLARALIGKGWLTVSQAHTLLAPPTQTAWSRLRFLWIGLAAACLLLAASGAGLYLLWQRLHGSGNRPVAVDTHTNDNGSQHGRDNGHARTTITPTPDKSVKPPPDHLPDTRPLAVRNIGTLEHLGAVSSLAFNQDGKVLASGTWDAKIILWDLASSTHTDPIRMHPPNAVQSMALSPDGTTVAACSVDSIKIWDLAHGKTIGPLEKHTRPILCVAFSPDGKTLASGSQDRTIKLWDVATGKEKETLTKHTVPVWSVAFSPDGKTLASGGGEVGKPGEVKLWDMASRENTVTLKGHSEFVLCVAFSADGKTLASGSADKTIKLWDVATGKNIATLTGHTSVVMSVAFRPDGKTLASGGGDKTVRLWDVASGQNVKTLEKHTAGVMAVKFSPDGKLLASGSGDKTIELWEVTGGE